MQRWGRHKAALGAMVSAVPGCEYNTGTVFQAAECDPQIFAERYFCAAFRAVQSVTSAPSPWRCDVEVSFSRCLELSSAVIHSSWVASLLWKRIFFSYICCNQLIFVTSVKKQVRLVFSKDKKMNPVFSPYCSLKVSTLKTLRTWNNRGVSMSSSASLPFRSPCCYSWVSDWR